jgi:BirA family biotin operon repressor/biotin-[acetyl-CoA-carboxylase] ligase
MGRSWVSHGNETDQIGQLTFSLGLTLQVADWSGLSLAVGVSVANSLHASLQLKWPNDIWFDERKMAGILIETASIGTSRYVVIGVGLNITEQKAPELATPPAWLQEILPQSNAQQALLQLTPPLVQAVNLFESQGLTPFLNEFARRDCLQGREVDVSDGTSGRAAGVDDKGALLVHTAAGLKKISSFEVSVRPLR